jgi:hypothetical protein
VLAAGEAYGGVEAKLVKQRAMLGTDGTVRIAGTSLNTRACSLDFRAGGARLVWWQESKFGRIPFAVFSGFNHGSIVNPATPGYMDANGPGAIALSVLRKKSTTLDEYAAIADTFDKVAEANYARMPEERKAKYQQFMMNCTNLGEFHQRLKAEGARLVLEVTGVSALPDVRYMKSTFVAYDPAMPPKGEPDLLFPNTTTLVDVILNRTQTDKLAVITGPTGAVVAMAVTTTEPPVEKTGRAALISPDQPGVVGV